MGSHLLASSALLLTYLGDNPIQLNEIDNATSNLLHGELDSADVSKSDDMLSMLDAITGIIDTSSNDNRTVALWKLYLRFTHILRLFVFAERTGKFILHLHCKELFIPVFHAVGHFAYAKCTRMYLQQMKSLTEKNSENDYHLFSSCGCFTVRRKDN